ncbi:hypothetical protein Lfu02_17380 [Longispora fulva]|uniref:Uncharacterized protein n=1 Tax=Longispora fulva TaxID=619741 RepID=A0A8J7KMA8_9ACTN|nr:hypothetical protein [Longispora fulva]MBG6140254.1 hypothetical protein [Longispora fulva]GIG57366.1 hypothetical protein Lfu02_17380 [Longispora fulva]
MIGPFRYSVRGALDIIERAPRDLRQVDVFKVAVNMGLLDLGGGTPRVPAHVDPAYAMTADLEKPLIMLQPGPGTVVVGDGWHRVYRAVVEGRRQLPAYLLTVEETEEVKTLGP